jgi:hypothetical protein
MRVVAMSAQRHHVFGEPIDDTMRGVCGHVRM